MIDVLACTVMPYAWGSRTAIAELTGRPSPARGPEAELWMGAHPMAPSRLTRGGHERALGDVIAEDPVRELGSAVNTTFGSRLPFLLKVLAANEPLSLQAHPTEAQARAGFEAEEGRGVPRDAPTRNYKDPSHKPELLAALTPFDALCGFRRAADTARLFDALGAGDLARQLRDAGLAATFRAIMSSQVPIAPIVEACAKHAGEFEKECAWAVRLAGLYPGDVGVVSALLLNHVRLAPGEAIYLGAGNLHAYLGGVGIEVMASSDNVLRGGLTKKHVDVPELMRVLDFVDGPVVPQAARAVDAAERTWDTPAREFRLSAIEVSGGPVARSPEGPEILLCTAGSIAVDAVAIPKGAAAFVSATTARYTLTGAGTVYRATVNL